MTTPRLVPYGSWNSPITSELIVAESIGFTEIALDGDDIYWVEMRPSEGGRNVVVRRSPSGKTFDVTLSPFNARTRVHEYGGGAMAVAGGIVYFSNFADQRLYRQRPGAEPSALTPAADLRYADGVVDRRRKLMYCVREDHTRGGEAANTIVSLDLEAGGSGTVLVEGNDFYAAPRLSPDGSRLAWTTWNHPYMPWQGTELWVGELSASGAVVKPRRVAGGVGESILQPEWSPDGVLYFTSDRIGWWNIHRCRDGSAEPVQVVEAEFAGPPWSFGTAYYGFASPRRIVCAYNKNATWSIADLDTGTGELRNVPTPFTSIGRAGLKVSPKHVVFVAGSSTQVESLFIRDLATGETRVLRRSSAVDIDEGYLSTPEAIEFPTEQGQKAHAFFYPPRNRDYSAPASEKPPLLVMSHGGPTGATSSMLRFETQYWTSRGISVVDVNYGGSTGYGTEYRRRLEGRWGVVDVNDCINAARYLIDRGDVDGERLMIRGASAGGYTTLAALTFTDVFKAGASYYGLSELETFAKDTHKFESHYLESLIGPYPERKDLYVQRSPLTHVDKLSCPLILFQGLEDKIVPPNQAELIVEVLRAKGLPVAYVPFEEEQHGFRRAENIKRALDGELYFYSRVFGFELAEPVEPVAIENL